MPFQELNRRDSWPPTILRLQDDNDDDLSVEDIDENPFAYFLTSPTPEEDDEFDFFEDLSAGIEGDGTSKTPVREVSPSSLQRIPLEQEDESPLGKVLSLPISLRDFTLTHEKRKKEKATRQAELDRTIAANAMRGRRTVRLAPGRTARGRGQTRSLSGSRPHSWREPSPEIDSIPEEREDIDDVPALSQDDNNGEQEGKKDTTTAVVPSKKT